MRDISDVNEWNKRATAFADQCSEMLNVMFADACPCAYPRFRGFIEWNTPLRFVDQEILFGLFQKHLTETSRDNFECPVCHSLYEQDWRDYSAFLWVLNVKMKKAKNLADIGSEVSEQIPFTIGFQGYMMELIPGKMKQAEIENVIMYLSEKKK